MCCRRVSVRPSVTRFLTHVNCSLYRLLDDKVFFLALQFPQTTFLVKAQRIGLWHADCM